MCHYGVTACSLLFLGPWSFHPAGGTLPPFSWSRVPTFAHCCNESGLFSAEILEYFNNQSFVVIEKSQGLQVPPFNHNAEDKIIAAAHQVKNAAAAAGSTVPHVYMYYQMDYIRTWYASGEAFDRHPVLELHNTSGQLVEFGSWHIYDFANEASQKAWVAAMADPMARSGGAIDGFLIDGYQNANINFPALNNVSTSHKAAWVAGLAAAGQRLRRAVGLSTPVIHNPGAIAPANVTVRLLVSGAVVVALTRLNFTCGFAHGP